MSICFVVQTSSSEDAGVRLRHLSMKLGMYVELQSGRSFLLCRAEREHALHQRAADDLFGAQVRPKKMQSSAVRGRGRGRGLKTRGM